MRNNFIQTATIADLPELKNLLQRGESDWSDVTLASCFDATYAHWLVFDSAQPAGFITVYKNSDTWEIMQIAVDIIFRRRGLAMQLMHHVIDVAKKNHIEKIQLEVRESNFRAIALYQRCDFMIVGLRKNYYADAENAVLMDCLLKC